MTLNIMATGLRFPEGPVLLPDGDIAVCEIESGRIMRVAQDGVLSTIANVGGGPNGAALGADGRLYVCNNGGFTWSEVDGALFPGHQPADYAGSSIQAVDLASGAVEVLYTHAADHPLSGPNDIVVDAEGGLWFTCIGKMRSHDQDIGGVYYARPDGNQIVTAARPVFMANGIALSPDQTTLYVASTIERTVFAFDILGPGKLAPLPPETVFPGRVVASTTGRTWLDSMAVTQSGKICVATLIDAHGIATIDPATGTVEIMPCPDVFTTNICFGGPDMRTAYITLSTSGRLARCRWPEPGLKLNF